MEPYYILLFYYNKSVTKKLVHILVHVSLFVPTSFKIIGQPGEIGAAFVKKWSFLSNAYQPQLPNQVPRIPYLLQCVVVHRSTPIQKSDPYNINQSLLNKLLFLSNRTT